MAIDRYTEPFAPQPEGKRALFCLHCLQNCTEDQLVYECRPRGLGAFLVGKRWYCPNKACTGAGVGFDLHLAEVVGA